MSNLAELKYISCYLSEAVEEPRFFCTAKAYDTITDEMIDVLYDFTADQDPEEFLVAALDDAGLNL